mgnify:CR=1 FL=1
MFWHVYVCTIVVLEDEKDSHFTYNAMDKLYPFFFNLFSHILQINCIDFIQNRVFV